MIKTIRNLVLCATLAGMATLSVNAKPVPPGTPLRSPGQPVRTPDGGSTLLMLALGGLAITTVRRFGFTNQK